MVGVFEGVGVWDEPVPNKLKESKSFEASAEALPSKKSVNELHAVVLPNEVGGIQTKTSSSSPATPVTENAPVVDK